MAYDNEKLAGNDTLNNVPTAGHKRQSGAWATGSVFVTTTDTESYRQQIHSSRR